MKNSETGIVLPLIAIILATCVILALALSVDTTRTKRGQAIALALAEGMCKAGAAELPITRQAVNVALGLLKGIDIDTGDPDIDFAPYIFLSKVNFVTPLPLANFGDADPYLPGGPGSGWEESIATYSQPAGPPSICLNNDCFVSGDVEDPAAQYPATFWDRVNFNGYIGCEVEIGVSTIISGTRIARGKAVYRTRLVGSYAENDSPEREGRGITIGIAPQVEITNTDNRFNFSAAYQDLDPLFDGGIADPKSEAFTAARNTWNPAGDFPQFSPKVFEGSAVIPEGSASRDLALMRCYNPYRAVYNTILYSMLARLSRHWATRKNMLGVIINSLDEGTLAASAGTNPPTTFIVPEGAPSGLAPGFDAMQPVYQMPYLNYRPSGGSKGPPEALSQTGHLCPFTTPCHNPPFLGGFPYAKYARHHMQVSSMLRDCIYVPNIGDDGIDTFADLSIDNFAYEPPAFLSDGNPTGDYPENFDPYWGFVNQPSHRLTVEDIGRHMTNAEECPFEWADDTDPLYLKPKCTKPVPNANLLTPPSGLRGDILAFMEYVAGNKGAYPFPGFFQSRNLAPPIIPRANPELTYTDGPSSHILLFLSKRLAPGESAAIANLVCNQISTTAAARNIVVVYIPTNSTDTRPEVMDDLKLAFNAPGSAAPCSSNRPNRVFHIVPYDPYDPNGLTNCIAASSGSSEASCFKEAWERLLDNVPGNATDLADNILKELFVSEVAL